MISLFILLAFFPQTGYSFLWEGFEKENLWLISADDKNKAREILINHTNFSEGSHSLKININKTTSSKKGFICRVGKFDLSGINTIQFDMFSDQPRIITLGLSTGPQYIWYESVFIALKPGWNKNISIGINESRWKNEVSFWECTIKPEDLNDTRKITFSFLKGEKGSVYLDNIRFIEKRLMNEAYQIPFEPIKKEKISNVNYLLSRLNLGSFAMDYSKGIIKEKDGLYSLQFTNVNNNYKAGYNLEGERNWKNISKLLMKVYNPTKYFLSLSVAFQIGNAWTWYESPQFLLKPKKLNTIILNLNAPYFKSEASDWLYNMYLYNKNKIKNINLLVYGIPGKTYAGKVTIKDFSLLPGKEFLPHRQIVQPSYKEYIDPKLYSKPQVTELYSFPAQINKYDKFELTFKLKGVYQNPFNPDEIYCEGIFTGPDGIVYKIPGFYYEAPTEEKKKTAKAMWKIRFAPMREGKWHFKLRIKNVMGEIIFQKEDMNFLCNPNNVNKGFIQTDNSQFFFEDKSIYYPYGLSLGWVVPTDDWTYLDYLKKFHNAGMNWTRIWNTTWGLCLEWNKPRKGLNRYSQKDADEWDQIIEQARESGIYLQFCIHNYMDLAEGYQWENNPYSYINGGPLNKPEDFFVNALAKKFFKRKLLYICARWGYATSIMAWELFNEVDLTTSFNEDNVTAWHKEMAQYIRSIDVNKHMITTSFSRRLAGDKTFSLPEIDFTQTHIYTEDFRQALFYIPSYKINKYKKAHVTAEIGGSVETGVIEAKDKQGIRIHDVLWYALFSAAPSSALYWWWDEYIKKNNLFYHFICLKDLTRDLNHKNKEIIDVKIKSDSKSDYIFAPVIDWEQPTGSQFELKNDEITGNGLISQYFQGINHKEWQIEPEFTMHFINQAKFLMNVETASYLGAGFSIFIDERNALSEVFPPLPGSTLGRQINKTYEVNIPKGLHTIKLKNNNTDWIKIKWFKFTNCVPDVEAHALKSDHRIFIWLKNRNFNIENVLKKKKIKSSKSGSLEVPNPLGAGEYTVQYYNTWNGKLIKKRTVSSDQGEDHIIIKYPEVSKDILIVIRKD